MSQIERDLMRVRRFMMCSGPKRWKRPLCWLRGHGYILAFYARGDPRPMAFCPYCGLDQELPA